ncbi:hypothetical protein GNP82_09260 [Aliivibrio fischeri]|uniref:Rap1a immunity protein domain-containing protein n=1 Tax=Aliivibrio fischeri TaxID=668 RepID=A0A6N3YW16_ALIFS|nr:hypothetical protein [Aliivibrio fischeri]MUK37739.1 hypothetical protein [Aliivibrio fischeri]MUK45119.1 hypothetical protein [Aliivibrio fischeri]MUK80778.1 hypothetical protein [Aliivibrio fischeri]MUK84213.1 hypothetical protein [Aliivibrio fischeri]MUL06525.1 hypothetical protein [Aliivibrio fischeri]
MKPINYVIAFLFLFVQPSYAFEHSNANPGSAEFLIAACQEYTELYNKKDEQGFGTFFTTSKEESFRAGYCLGAVMHTNSKCSYPYTYTPSVYQAAKVIASVNVKQRYSETKLLEDAVCR